jgi:hypothetical protein
MRAAAAIFIPEDENGWARMATRQLAKKTKQSQGGGANTNKDLGVFRSALGGAAQSCRRVANPHTRFLQIQNLHERRLMMALTPGR